jgi:hypothetical protein
MNCIVIGYPFVYTVSLVIRLCDSLDSSWYANTAATMTRRCTGHRLRERFPIPFDGWTQLAP